MSGREKKARDAINAPVTPYSQLSFIYLPLNQHEHAHTAHSHKIFTLVHTQYDTK